LKERAMNTNVQGLIEEGEAFNALGGEPAAAARPRSRAELARADRAFYRGVSVAFLVTALVGFGRTYFLKTAFHTPPLTPLVHVHGLVGTAWLVLLVAQTALVSARRVDLHMKLGIATALVAAAFVPLGIMVPLEMARHGAITTQRLVFLIFPLGQALMFGGFVGAAIWCRRRTELHKRLMVVGTAIMVAPAFSRLLMLVPMPEGPRPVVALVLTTAFVFAGMLHDWRARGRVHHVYIWGALAIFLSGPVRFGLGHTAAWQALARHLVG
jgi:hypothetical protein